MHKKLSFHALYWKNLYNCINQIQYTLWTASGLSNQAKYISSMYMDDVPVKNGSEANLAIATGAACPPCLFCVPAPVGDGGRLNVAFVGLVSNPAFLVCKCFSRLTFRFAPSELLLVRKQRWGDIKRSQHRFRIFALYISFQIQFNKLNEIIFSPIFVCGNNDQYYNIVDYTFQQLEFPPQIVENRNVLCLIWNKGNWYGARISPVITKFAEILSILWKTIYLQKQIFVKILKMYSNEFMFHCKKNMTPIKQSRTRYY